ncbi:MULTISPECIES: L-rhamnose mutarotase [unclassified Plantactinospora]|uniref:L-rhamnose mutarotase n=1 Tax=unclassified Plantactinospora TaxID=2631981 RepID=UPI000D16357E|nr:MULTISPECIES: L-rhamnose mutarotase [unclassified Plantactinospora]AVT28306.1 L-rhamnose mutarotase [Plantactinospora sp. BC1]AVT38461.1 L-rhamnose mutarotase [Plantactinospora sp. BB1]
MQRIALHTRLKPGREDEYDSVHQVIPAELESALRAAGVHTWRIWRDGQDLFHLVEVEDYRRMRHELRDHPANVPWQARMAELLEVRDDYSGNDSGLSLVWELPTGRPEDRGDDERDEETA